MEFNGVQCGVQWSSMWSSMGVQWEFNGSSMGVQCSMGVLNLNSQWRVQRRVSGEECQVVRRQGGDSCVFDLVLAILIPTSVWCRPRLHIGYVGSVSSSFLHGRIVFALNSRFGKTVAEH